MKVAEYNDVITMLGNPDTVSEGLIQLSEKLKTDELEYNKIVDSNNNLRDTNSKLALRITNTIPPEKHVEPTNEEIFDNLFASKFKEA